MLIYFLKTILIQAIGLGVYFLSLRNEKMFSYSRKYLWGVIVTSFIIPFIQIPVFEATEMVQAINQIPESIILPEVSVVVSSSKSLSFLGLVFIVYCLIASMLLLKLFLAYQGIRNIKKHALHQEPNIYISKKIKLPYSFLKNIYIPQSFVEHESLPMIISHENAHIEKRHSYDKIAISVLSHLFMFNPLFRLFHKELELIHEYEVDEKVIEVYSLESYLKSLLQSTIYLQSNSNTLTHSFFSSPIKNRIIMLHKKAKNKNFQRVATIAVMLSVLLAVVFFQSQEVMAQNNTSEVNHENKERDTVYTPNDNGTYTMTYENSKGNMVNSIIESEEFLRVLNKNTDSNSNWSISEDNGLVLNIEKTESMQEANAPSNQVRVIVNDTDGNQYSYTSGGMDTNVDIDGIKKLKDPLDVDMLHKNNGEHVVLDGPNSRYMMIDSKVEDVDLNGLKSIKSENVNAEFPGGETALMKYLISNLKYPQDAKDQKIEGMVLVEFVVAANGRVHSSMVLKRSKGNVMLFGEAQRVVQAMPNWEPAINENGEAVKSKMVLPIVFKL